MNHPPGAQTQSSTCGYPLLLSACKRVLIYLPVLWSKNFILQAQRSIPNTSQQSQINEMSLALRRISIDLLTLSPLILQCITIRTFYLQFPYCLSDINLLNYIINHSQRNISNIHLCLHSYSILLNSIIIKLLMLPNQASYNDKMTKVIALSSNYKRHYQNLNHAKHVVPFSDHKHMKKVSQLSTQKYRKLQLDSLQKDNEALIRRLQRTNSSVKKDFSPRAQPQHRTLIHNSSNKSILSNASDQTMGSNWRRRTIRQKQIQQENKKIAQRIMHPKMSKDINSSKFHRFFQKQQSYSRIRSKFSQRSQSIMKSLALGDLKLERKNVQFLPQLSFKHLDKSVAKALAIRSRQNHNATICNPEHH